MLPQADVVRADLVTFRRGATPRIALRLADGTRLDADLTGPDGRCKGMRPLDICLQRVAACAAALACLGLAPASAASPSPSVSPSPSPLAFAARAHADVTVDAQGRTMTGNALLGLSMRERLVRVDVLSVKTDAMTLPPITLTLVIDRGANTIAAWNDVTKVYHVQSFLPGRPASPSPKPSAAPKASAPPLAASPFSKFDVFAMTIKLTGHTTTSGVPTTGLSFDLQIAKKGDKVPSHVTVTTQLADEYAAFPVSAEMVVEPGAAPFRANAVYAVDEVTRELPPLSRFEVPAGYADAGSLFGVVVPRGAAAPAAGVHAH
jgi:hypothetical protein